MAEFRRALHVRIAGILSRMDPGFLERAQCYFGGGTQLVMAHGEYRESRDIDLLVSSPDGYRLIRETVNERSLGALFKERILLERELRADRYGVRARIMEDEAAEPIKLEIVLEGRIQLAGKLDGRLGVPALHLSHAIAEKLLANVDRGRSREHFSRDLVDLAFVCLEVDAATFAAGHELARSAYGSVVLAELNETLKLLTLDAAYRAKCVQALLVEDPKKLRAGLARISELKRALKSPASKAARRKPARR